MKCTIGLILFLSFGSAAAAGAYDESIDCARVDNEGGTGYELNQCAGRSINEVEFQLQRVYDQLRSEFKNTESAKVLVESQRGWLAWREKEAALCARSTGFGPTGSGYGTAYGGCKAALTSQRVQRLREYLKIVRSR